jgi:hypothetical protein
MRCRGAHPQEPGLLFAVIPFLDVRLGKWLWGFISLTIKSRVSEAFKVRFGRIHSHTFANLNLFILQLDRNIRLS